MSSAFGVQKLFSLASRERCLTNFKKYRLPQIYNPEKQLNKKTTPSAAVLVPLCSVNDDPCLLYTVRAANLKTDRGNVSFPGGKTDKDESPVETALRETKEEIGLSPEKIDIWGCGQNVPGRNYNINITPVIGCVRDLKEVDLCINKKEVEEAFAVPIRVLCDPKNQFYTQFKNGHIIPVFVSNKYQIWGVTAYITHVFLSCLLSKDLYRNDWMRKKIVIDEQPLIKN